MNKLTLDCVEIKGKRALVRVDFNVPMEEGRITDDARIVASLPTIKKLISGGAIVTLASHLGRPKGKPEPGLSLKPVAEHLQELLGKPVKFISDCVGEPVAKALKNAKPGDVFMLENLRFHPEEEKNDLNFAKELAKPFDLFVNDAFAVSHRAHASVVGVTKYINLSVAGYLVQKEIEYLGKLLEEPPRPFVAIVGGAKISTKIGVLKNLLDKVDKLLIGGGMAYTFFSALGLEVGNSIVESELTDVAMEIWTLSEEMRGKMLLPVDVLVVKEISPDSPAKTVSYDSIPPDWTGVDIGQATIQLYTDEILSAKTVFMNGPMGIFEIDKFAEGTRGVLEAMAEVASRGDIAVVGGGDSASSAKQLGFADQMSHVSTGGGASLEFLEGKTLPGIEALTNKS